MMPAAMEGEGRCSELTVMVGVGHVSRHVRRGHGGDIRGARRISGQWT
jgi:hypothetical protein